MTIEELIIYGKKYLHKEEVKLLLEFITGFDALELQNHLKEVVTSDEEKKFKELILARKNNYPLQYILGDVNFYGLRIKVNKNVLIPRFETEELAENTIKIIKEKFKNKDNLKILDLCTGSGAIGLKLKSVFKNAKVTLSDISELALKVAKENSESLGLDVEIIQGDLFENIKEKYDVIISNPPYIMEDEEIEDIVRENEPSIALFAGKDGLYFYKKILKSISPYLNDEFIIAFEIGQTQKDAVINLAKESLKDVNIYSKKDLQNKDRMVFIIK